MKGTYAIILVAVVVLVRLALRRRRRRGPSGASTTHVTTSESAREGTHNVVALVCEREIRQRVRGRMFRVATVVILLGVGAAIVIPSLRHSHTPTERVGVVGTLGADSRARVAATAASLGVKLHVTSLATRAAATAALDAGTIDVAILNGDSLLVKSPLAPASTSGATQFVRGVAVALGVARAQSAAGLSARQIAMLSQATPLAITSVHAGKSGHAADPTSIVGVILIFIMLSQYLGWILVGVMEEKSSRIVEVLLSTVRPIQVVTGKVLGIGLVAFAQAGIILAWALILARIVGSNLIHGTAPWALASILVWLVLGYSFYCWIYAAAGSMVERQDQAQTLAFPLTLPLIFGYVISLTTASSGNAAGWFKVFAYIPFTAPFAMPTLVGLGEATWWQFSAAVAIDVVCTVALARGAAVVYRRAILRTGSRVKIRELRAHSH
ncbi:MAG TPA: ABC transporter permease [Acidimicrobiales bacterium]|nr:ABC transporter permease [Acidimicrobiales bacterium]